MRSIILACFIFFQSIQLFAQNYSIIQSGRTYYFNSGEVRAIRWDSISANGQDSTFFSFKNIVDTTNGIGWNVCVDTVAGSLSGRTIFKKADSIYKISNYVNDTILFKPNAAVGDKWKLFIYPNNNYFEITVDSIGSLQFLGLTDSVKYFSIQAKNALGNNISSDFNGKTIIVSKNYGPFEWLDFFIFPKYYTGLYSLIGLTNPIIGFQNLTFKDIYNYDINDEFHLLNEETNWQINWTDTTWYIDNGYIKNTIRYVTNKYLYSDSVIYQYHNCIRTINFSSGISDTIFSEDTLTETIVFSTLAKWQFDHLPIEFIRDPVQDSVYFYYMQDSACGSLTMKSVTFNELMKNDSCYVIAIYDPGPTPYNFIEGCGGPYHYMASWTGYVKQNQLLYYKKGSKIWGIPIAADCADLFSGIHETPSNNLSVKIFPNPASEAINVSIDSPNAQSYQILIMNMLGTVVRESIIIGNHSQIDCSRLSKGIYFYKLLLKGEIVKTGKLIIQ